MVSVIIITSSSYRGFLFLALKLHSEEPGSHSRVVQWSYYEPAARELLFNDVLRV